MRTLELSNNGINEFIGELENTVSKLNIDKHNKTWMRLFLEESLLTYKDELGDSSSFNYNVRKRFSSLLVEIKVEGKQVNIFGKDNAVNGSSVVDSIFLNEGDGQILHQYKNNKNVISLSMPIEGKKIKIPGSPSIHAILLAIVVGFLLKLMPASMIDVLVESYISPVYSTLMSALKGLMEPVIFISLVIGICALDDLRTLSTIGKKAILSFLKISTIMFAITVVICFFVFPCHGEVTQNFNLADIINLLLTMIPINIIAPFYEGNMVQIVVIGFMSGIIILILGEKASTIKQFTLEFKFFFFTILEMFVKLLPFIVFLSVVKVILTISISDSATVWKIIVVDQAIVILVAALNLVSTSLKTKVSVKTLIKKIMPIFNLSLMTGSSTAVIPEFYNRLPSKFGIDEKYANYWIPLSNAFFSPSTIVALIVYAFFSSQMQGVAISISWVVILYIMIIQIGMATPRIPGGIIASCTILFSQLGVTTDYIGIIMAANVLVLYLDTAVAAITRCCCAIDVAYKEGYIDLEILADPNR